MSPATDLADRIAAAFSGEGASAYAACFAEDGRLVHPMLGVHEGREAIAAAEGMMFSAFDDVDFVVLDVVDGGDTMALEYQVSATHTGAFPGPDGTMLEPTGIRVSMNGAAMIRLSDDGLIAETHRYEDFLSFLAQLGLMG